MQYYNLRFMIEKKDRARVIKRLRALRTQLDKEIPSKDAEDSLLLATWNIRDFDKVDNRGFGKRRPESFFYLAEIISRFDFVAVQEVNGLDEWENKIMRILGPDWDYIASDVTDRSLGGNGERLTYVFDKRKVRFQNVAGELVLPNSMLISKVTTGEGKKLYAGKQFRRTPYLCRFQAGWFKFDICSVHIYYGDDYGAKLQERIEEIEAVAKYLGKRAKKQAKAKDQGSLILLGDFNIVRPDHKTMDALTDNGFKIPEGLGPSNATGTKYYDQIAFLKSDTALDDVSSGGDDPSAGIFNMFKKVFTTAQYEEHRTAVAQSPNGKALPANKRKEFYKKKWRTYQISDHKPMWVRLKIDASDDYLKKLAKE